MQIKQKTSCLFEQESVKSDDSGRDSQSNTENQDEFDDTVSASEILVTGFSNEWEKDEFTKEKDHNELPARICQLPNQFLGKDGTIWHNMTGQTSAHNIFTARSGVTLVSGCKNDSKVWT